MFGDSETRRDDPRPDDAKDVEPMGDAHDAEADASADPPDGGDERGLDILAAMAPTPPVTGDEAVDEAMTRLAQAQAGSGSFAERIESGEHAHRSLQSRLGGLGGA